MRKKSPKLSTVHGLGIILLSRCSHHFFVADIGQKFLEYLFLGFPSYYYRGVASDSCCSSLLLGRGRPRTCLPSGLDLSIYPLFLEAASGYKEWLLPREKLVIILSFFKQPKQEIEDSQELQKYCFVKVVKACRKAKYEKVAAASAHLFGLLDEHGRSVYQTVIEDEKNTSIVENFLIEISRNPIMRDALTYGDYALTFHHAARRNRYDLLLCDKKIELLEIRIANRQNLEGKTPLHVAIENGATQFVAEFLKKQQKEKQVAAKISLEARFEDTKTGCILSPFSLAVAKGEIECLDLLVAHAEEKKYLLSEYVPGVGNLLHVAIQFGQIEMLNHLLTKYLDQTRHLINKRKYHPFGLTSLALATMHGDREAMLMLIVKGADIEMVDYEQKTFMAASVLCAHRYYAASGNRPKTVETLLANQANPNVQNEEGKTPLHLTKDIEIVKTLVLKGANPLARDGAGKTPRDYALFAKNNELAEFLKRCEDWYSKK